MPSTSTAVWPQRWQRLAAASLRSFHAYANWLVGISWRRFAVLAVLLLIAAAFLREVPPFSWSYTRKLPRPEARVVVKPVVPPGPPAAPASPTSPTAPTAPQTPSSNDPSRSGNVELKVDRNGVRIGVDTAAASAGAASAPSAPSSASAGTQIDIKISGDSDAPQVREAIEEARRSIEEAVREARDAKREADQEVRAAAREARNAGRDVGRELGAMEHELGEGFSVREVSLGRFLPNLALFWIVASAIIKITYKRQIQAEAQAAQAVEVAEAESLKRQVVEARMAAMQAQVEPHFLFNTLASIDHLIEVDPPRASQMQKHLIALLRASMPNLRDVGDSGRRDLGQELAMIRPYLEILKVRMEERLSTVVDVPDGLLSAEFPPMMLQTLVENAIKHGLEPKPEGGAINVKAEIVHGKLSVSVADTGLGFGRAATAGTGVGLSNIRERLQLRYGAKASLTITENRGSGTVATISLPYRSVADAAA